MSYPPPPEGDSPDPRYRPGEHGQPPPYGEPGYYAQQPPYGQPAYGYGQPGYGYGYGYGQPPAYAPWLHRVGAYLVDNLIMLPGYIAYGLAGAFTDAQGNPTGTGFALLTLGLVYVVVVGIWNIVFRQGRTGWSVGKQALGIRLLSERTGRPIGAGLSFVRQLAHILDSLPCYLGYLWPLWDQRRQTFADKIMGTVVVHQRKDVASPPAQATG